MQRLVRTAKSCSGDDVALLELVGPDHRLDDAISAATVGPNGLGWNQV